MSDGAWKIQELASEDLPHRATELGQLFPEAMTDGRVDIEKLKLLLGEAVEESPERYGLTWPGKRDAIRLAQKQSTATLKPMAGESVAFDITKNVIVEGDNLEVLKLLQKSYYGKVKLIYIDPPYNTGNDFVYRDDFAEPTQAYLRRSGQVDGDGFRTSANREASGRFHSDWLSMMYARLVLARTLLREDGGILISLDDNELANAIGMLKEVFGEEGFVSVFPWKSRTAKSDVPFGVSVDHEWIILFARSNFLAGRSIERKYYESDDTDEPWRLQDLRKNTTRFERPNSFFDLVDPKTGRSYPANPNRTWSITPSTFDGYYAAGKIVFPGDYDFLRIGAPAFRVFKSEDQAKAQKKYGSDSPMSPISSDLDDATVGRSEHGNKEMVELFGEKIFSFPKPTTLIRHFLRTMTDTDALVLDFFAGSGTTGHAVLAQNAEDGGNRRFILVQLPEETDNPEYPKISDITRERVRRAGKKIKEEGGENASNLDVGFRAFRLAESNFRNWDSDTDAFLSEELDFYVDNINSGASDDDVVHEILLKAGVPLDVDLKRIQIAGENVYVAMGGLFVTSAARKISQELIDGLLALEPWPVQVVLLDAGFGDNDSLKLNARHQFASRRPESDPDKDNALRTV